jgi:hypothetical protein
MRRPIRLSEILGNLSLRLQGELRKRDTGFICNQVKNTRQSMRIRRKENPNLPLTVRFGLSTIGDPYGIRTHECMRERHVS